MASAIRTLTHNANRIYDDAITLQELRQNFTWKNPGYRTYHIEGPNPPYEDTAVIIKFSIQHTVIAVPRLKSLQATLVRTKLGNYKVLLSELYLSPSKLINLEDFDKLIVLAPN